jgi:Fe-S-cluster containining protein
MSSACGPSEPRSGRARADGGGGGAPSALKTWCLTLHAQYRCRHAGACCRNWAVPAEPHVVELVEARRIRREGVHGPLFVELTAPHERPRVIVARDGDGRCVFHDRDGDGPCVIHREAGADALPSACRHFPRQILRDLRGTFISLSHFCPTAAAMLLTRDPLQLVEAEPPLRLSDPVEGLDATDALPPLVRPGVLSDLAGYTAWEQACVATFARADLSYQDALDLVAAATEDVRDWRPGSGTLAERVRTAFRDARPEAGADPLAQTRAIETVQVLCAGRAGNDVAPIDRFEEIWQERIEPANRCFDVAMKNYLAGRVFANWIAYQGRGLRSIVEWLRTCSAVVRHQAVRLALELHAVPGRGTGSPADPGDVVEGFRMADLLLLHVLDTQAFARRAAPIEGPDPR